ncbi:MAG TPA: ATP-binding cassette domain-containing protein, partial [Petrotogaceae bacterium]|nr:ATP-binding cassette domain-containing protein [Petrotogaceae bacterium]
MENIIEVSNLRKYYKTVKAVDDISFSIAAGKVFALLGPNGAGKTTTVEILEGLRRADSGRITYFGKEITKVNFELKEKIGVQLQN